jgi:PPK2 family polyphosphate:nucleotide phosphotransferase
MEDKRASRIAEVIKPFLVKPGGAVVLGRDFDPGYTADYLEKEQSEGLLAEGVSLLREYQARLAAQNTYGLLVIIQALDAAGKDGTISHVMSGVNPQGVSVQSFKAPSIEELDHDYLWRCAKVLPARGDITIFNRSYYEEVLVVRVHPEYLNGERIPESCKKGDIWKRRYREINDWERYLVDNGFRIVKLFLNVSKEEQRRRFLDRLEEPDKNWKFSVADAAERSHWDEYQQAFSEMLSNTSTRWAPWYVVPADHKWFARVTAAAVIVDALANIDPQYPVVTDEARQALLQAKATLEAEAPEGSKKRPPESEGQGAPAIGAVPGGAVEEAAPEAAAPEAADPKAEAPVEAAPGAETKKAEGDGGDSKPSTKSKGMVGKVIAFGEIQLEGKRYRDDLVINGGKIRKRRKKGSKAYRGEDGHTPLSMAEKIPWGAGRLVVGTGIDGALPIMAEVYQEADRRGVEVVAAPLEQALLILREAKKKDTFALLHITC